MSDKCVFCRIVAGEIPASKVYEDDAVLAFLDIAPINPGHILVIPKDHHYGVTTIPEPLAGRLLATAAKIGAALLRAAKADGFNLLLSNGTCAGQVVQHAHLHVIPRFPDDGVVLPARSVAYVSDQAKAELLAEIRKRLSA